MEMQREGDRGLEDFRSVFIKTQVLSQAKGSAYVEFQNTKVMVGIFGPYQSERKSIFSELGKLQCDVKLTSFAARQKSKQNQMALERDMSDSLCEALTPAVILERFPKAVIGVQVMVLESGGSDLAACITAASVALADALIEMRDLVTAVAMSRMNGQLYLDPAYEEEQRQDGHVLVAVMPSLNEVTHLSVRGTWTPKLLTEALELGLGASSSVRAAMRDVLLAS